MRLCDEIAPKSWQAILAGLQIPADSLVLDLNPRLGLFFCFIALLCCALLYFVFIFFLLQMFCMSGFAAFCLQLFVCHTPLASVVYDSLRMSYFSGQRSVYHTSVYVILRWPAVCISHFAGQRSIPCQTSLASVVYITLRWPAEYRLSYFAGQRSVYPTSLASGGYFLGCFCNVPCLTFCLFRYVFVGLSYRRSQIHWCRGV